MEINKIKTENRTTYGEAKRICRRQCPTILRINTTEHSYAQKTKAKTNAPLPKPTISKNSNTKPTENNHNTNTEINNQPTEKEHITNTLTIPQNNANTNIAKDTKIIYDLDALSDTSIGSKDSVYVEEITNTPTTNKSQKKTDTKKADTVLEPYNSKIGWFQRPVDICVRNW